jgi:hypothetical protein
MAEEQMLHATWWVVTMSKAASDRHQFQPTGQFQELFLVVITRLLVITQQDLNV